MWKLLPVGIGLGLIDCLNPFTISTQIVLQPFVKKSRHTLYYIFGTYLSYLIGGMFIYCFIYTLLLFIVYFLYLWSKSKLERLIEAVRKKFAALASWATIILVACAGVFLIVNSLINLI